MSLGGGSLFSLFTMSCLTPSSRFDSENTSSQKKQIYERLTKCGGHRGSCVIMTTRSGARLDHAPKQLLRARNEPAKQQQRFRQTV